MADYDIYENQGGGYNSLQEQPFPLEDDVSRLIFGDNGPVAPTTPALESNPDYFNSRLNQVGVQRPDLDPRFYLSARRQVEIPAYDMQQPGTQCLTQPCQPEYDPTLLTTGRLRPEDIMRLIMAANGQYSGQTYQPQWNNPQYPIYQPGRVPPSQVQAYQLIRALLDRQGIDSRGMYPSDYPSDPTYINQQQLRFMPQQRCVPQQQYDPRFPQGLDPRFLRQFEPTPRGSQTFDPRFPQTYDPRINQVVFDPRFPQGYDPRFQQQQYDPRFQQQQYDPRFQQYDPRFQQYDPRFQQYDPRFQQYDPRFQQYDPRIQQYDPRFQVDPRYRFDPRYQQQCDQGGQNGNLGRQLLLRYGLPLVLNSIGGNRGYRGGYPGGFGGGGFGGFGGNPWGGGYNGGFGGNGFYPGNYNRGWGGGGGRGYIQLGRFGIRL